MACNSHDFMAVKGDFSSLGAQCDFQTVTTGGGQSVEVAKLPADHNLIEGSRGSTTIHACNKCYATMCNNCFSHFR